MATTLCHSTCPVGSHCNSVPSHTRQDTCILLFGEDFSPDQSFLAYDRRQGDQLRLVLHGIRDDTVINVPGGVAATQMVEQHNVHEPPCIGVQWSPDGRRLLILRRGAHAALSIYDVASGQDSPPCPLPDGAVVSVDWGQQRIVYNDGATVTVASLNGDSPHNVFETAPGLQALTFTGSCNPQDASRILVLVQAQSSQEFALWDLFEVFVDGRPAQRLTDVAKWRPAADDSPSPAP